MAKTTPAHEDCMVMKIICVGLLLLVGCTPKLPLVNDPDPASDSGDTVPSGSAVEVLSAEDDPLLGIVVSLSGGTFLMGSAEGDEGAAEAESPQHEVTLTSFAIMKREVSQGLYEEVMGTNPSLYFAGCDACPVETVSWDEAAAFAAAVSEMTGLEWRLPTEAEWECAARGGEGFVYAGSDVPSQVAWTRENSADMTQPGCALQPNGYELCDMSGNVKEWVLDWNSAYPKDPVTDPAGPLSGSRRVVRGGSWYGTADGARVATRYTYEPGDRVVDLGFRLVRPVH